MRMQAAQYCSSSTRFLSSTWGAANSSSSGQGDLQVQAGTLRSQGLPEECRQPRRGRRDAGKGGRTGCGQCTWRSAWLRLPVVGRWRGWQKGIVVLASTLCIMGLQQAETCTDSAWQ